MDLQGYIRDIPDFPKKGIIFKDITTLLRHPKALREAVAQLSAPFKNRGIDSVLGIEARGFILAPAVALELGTGFIPVRKPGKLPAETVKQSYSLEYGEDSIEVHRDAVDSGDKILIVDDLLATGGTAKATVQLAEGLGARIEALAFLIELTFLDGHKLLKDHEVFSIIKY